MPDPMISIDVSKFQASLRDVQARFKDAGDKAIEAVRIGMAKLANDIVGDAAQNAQFENGHGHLQGAGSVEGPEMRGSEMVCRAGFNKKYARVRDEGTGYLPGGVIRPTTKQFLFIPLKPGIDRWRPDLVRGEDYVLAKQVKQTGNRFFSKVIEKRKATMAQDLGSLVYKELQKGGA